MDFLPDLDLFYIIVIRKSSFSLGTFGLGHGPWNLLWSDLRTPLAQDQILVQKLPVLLPPKKINLNNFPFLILFYNKSSCHRNVQRLGWIVTIDSKSTSTVC